MRRIFKRESFGPYTENDVVDLKLIGNSQNYFVMMYDSICKHCHPGGRCWLSGVCRGD